MAEQTTTEQENAKLVRSFYDSLASGDLETVLDHLSPDIHWVQPEGGPFPGTFEGPEEVRRNVLGRLRETLGDVTLDVKEAVPAGERVYVHLRIHGTAPTGNRYDIPAIHVWQLRGEKAVAFEAMGDTALFERALRV